MEVEESIRVNEWRILKDTEKVRSETDCLKLSEREFKMQYRWLNKSDRSVTVK